jgi:hypothetical protein
MAIPDFQSLMLPLVEFAADGQEHSLREAREFLAKRLRLTHGSFYCADAWIDRETLDEQDGGIGNVGFEINFNREYFQYQPPRPLDEIDSELEAVEKRIMGLLREVTK